MRATAEDLKAHLAAGGDRSDWRRVRAMTPHEVEVLADEEDGPLPDAWADKIRLQPQHIEIDTRVRQHGEYSGLVQKAAARLPDADQ